MSEADQDKKSDFMIEKIKERPINRKKLLRRTLITASMAVIFGLVACLTFLLLEPVLSNWLYPPEEPDPIIFPEDQEEMSPEEMLSDTAKEAEVETVESVPIREQIQEELGKMNMTIDQYQQLDRARSSYITEISQYMVTIWDSADQYEKGTSICGVLIADNGQDYMILATLPIFQENQRFTAVLYNDQRAPIQLRQRDPQTGLTIFSIPHNVLPKEMRDTLKVASLGFSSISNVLGISVMAVGKPLGTLGSVESGMIAGAGTQLEKVDANYDILMTDVIGDSQAEGFLFNMKREVVGVIIQNDDNTAAENWIRAYSISDLRKLIERLINEKERAYLGIYGTNVTVEAHEEMEVPYGAYVRETVMESPAMLVGIQQGDVIVEVNGDSISDFDRYASAILNIEPGEEVQLTVMRQTQVDDDTEYQEMSFQISSELAEQTLE
jgi:serine protease Do